MTPRPRLLSCIQEWPGCSEGDYNPRCCRFPKSCSCTVYPPGTDPDLLEDPPAMSAPNPCRSCGTALQHCLEMRNGPSVSRCGTYCCAPCADSPDLHETEQAPGTRTAAEQFDVELVPSPHGPDSLPSTADQVWSLDTAPPEVQYAVRNSEGDIFPMPSRKVAQQLVDIGPAPDLQVVSRTVSPWEVLR